jgi:hypothetical protein
MKKLYIVVNAALNAGLIAAQACHALRQFVGDHPVLDAQWHAQSNNIVVLEHDDVASIAARMEASGLAVSRFHEPDLDDALTAIAVEPHDGRLLSNLPLAGGRERRLLRRVVGRERAA